MTAPLIETEGLAKSYGSRIALHPLDWTLNAGSITGILGPNGAGKTTLVKLLLGITQATDGSARVLGHDVAVSAIAVRGEVGFVPEDKLLYDDMPAHTFLDFYGSYFATWDGEAAHRLMTAWDIDLAARIKELSKGNRAKLVLGAVLCRKPRVLLLDEPTIDLDPASAEETLSLIAGWAAEGERAVVITTHRLEEVERVCDRVLILHEGRAVLEAELDALREQWKRIRASGDLPAPGEIGSWPGVRHVTAGGEWASVVVDRDASRTAERLAEGGATDVVVEDINLREIFLTMMQYEHGRLEEALGGVA